MGAEALAFCVLRQSHCTKGLDLEGPAFILSATTKQAKKEPFNLMENPPFNK